MSGYGNVMVGKLKLKKPSGSSAAATASAKAVEDTSSKLSGSKRRSGDVDAEGRLADEREGRRHAHDPKEGAVAPPAAAHGGSGGSGSHAAADKGSKEARAAAEKDTRTAAEKAFEEAHKRRQKEEVAKMASQSHREKVNKMNEMLAKMPEHHDIPKISYAGQG